MVQCTIEWIVEMNEKDFETLKQGMKEAAAFKRGELQIRPYKVKIKTPDVRKIRKKTGLTQEEFAMLFGWSKDTVSSWEQGRRVPEHSAKAMLTLISADPGYVLGVLQTK